MELDLPYFRYNLTSVLENSRALLYWDRSIITDSYIVNIWYSISWTSVNDNLVKAEKELLSKYLYLVHGMSHEVTAMWDVNVYHCADSGFSWLTV